MYAHKLKWPNLQDFESGENIQGLDELRKRVEQQQQLTMESNQYKID